MIKVTVPVSKMIDRTITLIVRGSKNYHSTAKIPNLINLYTKSISLT